MIGHYLLTLSDEREDRLLTQHFYPGTFWAAWSATGHACLVGTACGSADDAFWQHHRTELRENVRGRRIAYMEYEHLAKRFGVARVNAAIRNRILSNRARRVLTHEVGSVGAVLGRPE